jgi:hypothetical protein
MRGQREREREEVRERETKRERDRERGERERGEREQEKESERKRKRKRKRMLEREREREERERAPFSSLLSLSLLSLYPSLSLLFSRSYLSIFISSINQYIYIHHAINNYLPCISSIVLRLLCRSPSRVELN